MPPWQGHINKCASFSHLTGHPKCVQLAAKAIKLVSLFLRSHAADFAVIPAYGFGSALIKVTRFVVLILKSLSFPTVLHFSTFDSSNGARTALITGMAATAALKPARLRPSLIKNFLLLISSFSK